MAAVPAGLADALQDRYRLDRELSQGGMATVYLAQDLRHHRPVALKVLRPDLVATLGTERFLREIQVEAGLTHPHILPLHDSGEAEGLLYYVMPFIEGESLRDRLVRDHSLPVAEAVRLGREVADALAYAHSHGIVHRDIKPENILLSSGHAVVADFGIARAIDVAGGGQITEAGTAVGSPMYMSPEQAGGGSRAGRPERCVQPGVRAVRSGDRAAAVFGADSPGDHGESAVRGPAADPGGTTRAICRVEAGLKEGDGDGARRSLHDAG